MHLGLIGGIGLAATEFYYRGLVRRYAAADRAMELTIVHAQIAELARNQAAGEADAQADVFADLVGRLKAAGADVAAVTSLGGHFCIRELERISPLPMVNLVAALDAAIGRTKVRPGRPVGYAAGHGNRRIWRAFVCGFRVTDRRRARRCA